jgi:hypothetical protein
MVIPLISNRNSLELLGVLSLELKKTACFDVGL